MSVSHFSSSFCLSSLSQSDCSSITFDFFFVFSSNCHVTPCPWTSNHSHLHVLSWSLILPSFSNFSRKSLLPVISTFNWQKIEARISPSSSSEIGFFSIPHICLDPLTICRCQSLCFTSRWWDRNPPRLNRFITLFLTYRFPSFIIRRRCIHIIIALRATFSMIMFIYELLFKIIFFINSCSCLTTKSSFQTTWIRSGLAFLIWWWVWLRLLIFWFLSWWRVFRFHLVTDQRSRCLIRLDDLTRHNSSAGSATPALIFEDSSSTPFFVQTLLWTRDCSPVIFLHPLLVPFFISIKVVRADPRSSKGIGLLEPSTLNKGLRSVLWWRINSFLW